MRQPKPLSEAHIQETCSHLLALDDWRRVRMDMKQLRGMGVQEPGMADDLFIRYLFTDPWNTAEIRAHTEAMWIEWKSKRGKASDHQKAWHTLERKRGALVLVAGQDFFASIEGFKAWYKYSGLMRKRFT